MTCALEHKEQMRKSAACSLLLERLDLVVFSDYSIIQKYISECSSDIDKFACGRITFDVESNDAPDSLVQHSQVTFFHMLVSI